MKFDEFASRVEQDVRISLGGNAKSVECKEVENERGEPCTTLIITLVETSVKLIINLNTKYKDLTNGISYGRVLKEIIGRVKEVYPGQRMNLSMQQITDYEIVRPYLVAVVVGTKQHTLDDIPHTEIEDLSIIYQIEVAEEVRFTIDDKLLNAYGISKEQLHTDAMDNTEATKRAVLRSVDEMLAMLSEGLDTSAEESAFTFDGAPLTYAATTARLAYGAIVIFYDGFLRSAAERLGGNFYILPSSVHEVLFVVDDGTIDSLSLLETVRTVNHTKVPEEDRLTDNVYYYDSVADEFRTAI